MRLRSDSVSTRPSDACPAERSETPRERMERIFLSFRDQLFAVQRGMLHNYHDAENALQEAMLSVWRFIDGEGDIRYERTFTLRVGCNTAKDIRRSHQFQPLEEVGEPAVLAGDEVERLDTTAVVVRAVRAAVAELPCELREAVECLCFCEFTLREGEQLLGVPHSTLRKRRMKALHLLREGLSALWEAVGG